MNRTIAKIHMAVDINGLLSHYKGRSMRGVLIDDNGNPCSDAAVRKELQDHLAKGHTCLPMCDPAECPDFDYTGGGCPGHGIHYYDNDGNEVSKAEWEAATKGGAE